MDDSGDVTVVGVIAIGRNEGERLCRCLESVCHSGNAIVYVDSCSTDGSVAMAHSKGVAVVELDMSISFTAARARNEGFRRLRELVPDVRYVQFVDGDCEVVTGWLEKAAAFLDQNENVSVVCGRRRERYPERSIYNALCDMEWDTPLGEARACGGDAMFRADAYAAIKGYRDDLIAGEEPELCVRLRAGGSKVWRLDAEMTLHDAAMTRFGQWWKRTLRSGYAFAEGAYLHGRPPERHWVRESRSAWVWGAGIPLAGLAASVADWAWGIAILMLYPVQVIRLALRGERSPRENWWRSLFLVVGKFAEMAGQVKFHLHRLSGIRARLIEYK